MTIAKKWTRDYWSLWSKLSPWKRRRKRKRKARLRLDGTCSTKTRSTRPTRSGSRSSSLTLRATRPPRPTTRTSSAMPTHFLTVELVISHLLRRWKRWWRICWMLRRGGTNSLVAGPKCSKQMSITSTIATSTSTRRSTEPSATTPRSSKRISREEQLCKPAVACFSEQTLHHTDLFAFFSCFSCPANCLIAEIFTESISRKDATFLKTLHQVFIVCNFIQRIKE
mmetsp:Transcript_34490/g.108127  ORF Transcript_34490/g.108127 Transcript_34490/m.108127 type:complete len:225 (+) Transcript_34490:416-1090(+)